MLNLINLKAMIITAALYLDSWKTSLPIMFYGMIGIFIVIGVIVLVTYFLNKSTSKKGKDKNENENDK